MSSLKIEAPFTPQQVIDLNKYQEAGFFHPFTCGNENKTDQDHNDGERGRLIATVDGWICPFCNYKQNWAHDFMADNLRLESMRESINELIKSKS